MSDIRKKPSLPSRPRSHRELRNLSITLRFTQQEAMALRDATGYENVGDAVQSLVNPILDAAGL